MEKFFVEHNYGKLNNLTQIINFGKVNTHIFKNR